MGASFGNSQRKHVRVDIDIDMHLVFVDAKAAGLLDGKERIQLRRGKISNLSVSGMKVRLEDLGQAWHFYLLSGAIVFAIKFSLPGVTQPICATAQVVRIGLNENKEPGLCVLGLKFVDIKPEGQAALNQFIAQRSLSADRGDPAK